jgi:hypothetical protein
MWYRWRNGESDYWRKIAFEPLGEQVVGQLFLSRADDEDDDIEAEADDDEVGVRVGRRRPRRATAREPGSEGAFEFEVSGRDPVVLMGIEVIGGSV